jgi:hypothetical protein
MEGKWRPELRDLRVFGEAPRPVSHRWDWWLVGWWLFGLCFIVAFWVLLVLALTWTV